MHRRRIIRRLRVMTVKIATFAVILLPTLATIDGHPPPALPGPYMVTDLGTFGTVQSAQAHGINDAGQVVGYAATHAFRNLSGATGAFIPQNWGVNIQGTGVIKNDDW